MARQRQDTDAALRSRGSRGGSGRGSARPGWMAGKRPVFQFVGLFVVFMGVFYAITFVPAVQKRLIPSYMVLNARVSTFLLNVFGEGATQHETQVASRRYSVDIRHGCDAVEPTALFVSAVLAFPAAWKAKLPGVLVGAFILAVINLVRIVSLFYTGIYFPRAFEIMHIDVWQPAFVLLALSLWILWALWATRNRKPKKIPDGAT